MSTLVYTPEYWKQLHEVCRKVDELLAIKHAEHEDRDKKMSTGLTRRVTNRQSPA